MVSITETHSLRPLRRFRNLRHSSFCFPAAWPRWPDAGEGLVALTPRPALNDVHQEQAEATVSAAERRRRGFDLRLRGGRVRMLQVMLPQQILAVVVAVRRADDDVDVLWIRS